MRILYISRLYKKPCIDEKTLHCVEMYNSKWKYIIFLLLPGLSKQTVLTVLSHFCYIPPLRRRVHHVAVPNTVCGILHLRVSLRRVWQISGVASLMVFFRSAFQSKLPLRDVHLHATADHAHSNRLPPRERRN